MSHAVANNYRHPYDFQTARWIRKEFILQKDEHARKELLESLGKIFGARAPEVLRYISKDYRVMIRDDQLIPDYEDKTWHGAVFCCGRAFGKTWCGSPATIEFAMKNAGARIGLLAPTFAMGRQNMIQGSSGILALSPKGFKPRYNKSEGSLTWANGSTAKVFSAENGDRVRGENFHFVWADEFCFFKFTGDDSDIWKMAKMALRAGTNPRYIITTSPRPIKEIKDLYETSKKGTSVRFTTGTTFDNYSLPQDFIDDVKLGEGTTLYNQEVLGMILETNLGAIFDNKDIQRTELDNIDLDPDEYNDRMYKFIQGMDEVVIAVDPNVVDDEKSDETGVVVCGRKGSLGYVIKDASRRGRISDIYEMIVGLYHEFQADSVIVETNNGGDFIPTAIFNIDPMVVVKKVFASKGKKARAEPIGLLYERKKIYHVGVFTELEAQMTEYNPTVHKKSPDRLDAMVWGFTHLFPSTMRGLFNSSNTHTVYGKAKNEEKVEDLFKELYETDSTNDFGLSSFIEEETGFEDIDGDDDYGLV